MVDVKRVEEGIGIGFHGASELLSVMDFIQELAFFAREEFENGKYKEYSDAGSVEELMGQMCMMQLIQMEKRIEANPEMLDELKISAMKECSGSHRSQTNDTMYG